jgi:hypothetical protein
MALREIQFRPGVVKDDTELASRGYGTDSDRIRFVDGRAEALGGWTEKQAGVAGKPRACHEWSSVAGVPFLAIATTTKLYVHTGTRLIDITPLRASDTLGANPFATTSGSSIVTVTDAAHGAIVGDTVWIRGAAAVATITLGGLSGTMAASAFLATLGSRWLRVLHTAHGLNDNDIAHFAGATTFSGIPAGDINVATGLRVRVLDANNYQVEVPTEATSSGSGGGTPTYAYAKPYLIIEVLAGGNSYTVDAGANANATTTGGGAAVKIQYDLSIGSESTRLSTGGYGSGLYGRGLYGRSANAIETDVSLPLRQWSLDNMGDALIANVVGSTIYVWAGVQGTRAIVLTNAPARCLAVLTTPERYLLACGCTSAAGVFDPTLVRHTDGENITTWTASATNNAGTFRIGSGSAVVGVRKRNDNPMIWSDTAPFSVQFVGEADRIYEANQIGESCGLISINAVAGRDSDVYWITPSRQLYVYRGGPPVALECPLQSWLKERLTLLQIGKLFCWTDPGYEAVSWLFSANGSVEPNEYLRLDVPEAQRDSRAGWSHGTTDDAVRANGTVFPERLPLSVSSAGAIRTHEDGYGAGENVAVASFIHYAPMSIVGEGEDGHHQAKISRIVVDMILEGEAQVTVSARRRLDAPLRSRTIALTPAKKQVDTRISGQMVGLEVRADDYRKWRLGLVRGDVSVGSMR